ncbi:CHASE domain-containing protein [Azohydromonas caseinilytica]|uniref:Sensory/regulatory protein RpfC n=1 Tax=Azohydromonas caseinilytica TaxID=2728836 RepID=A0A848FE21_9BURK|nr:CHASE domain-containing protein [Azohydromonas caseinilytica]NML16400.1 response regulator [Azohydromonas caseinilytica]
MGSAPQPGGLGQGVSATAGRGRNGRSTWLIPLAVLAASLTLTGTGVLLLERSIAAATEARFTRLVERVERDMRLRFQQPVYAVDGLRSLYAAMPDLDRRVFREYVRARDLPRNFPSVRGLGYVQRVSRDELGSFIAAEQAQADAGFQVYTQTQSGDLYVLRFIEPLERNRKALGFDMGSETVRREAIERAARTGQATLTSRITLLQDELRGAGFMFMAPIYRPGAPLGTAEQRLAALSGLAVAPVVVQQLMAGLSDLTERQLQIHLFDGADTQAAQQVFASEAEPAAGPQPQGWLASRHEFSATRELMIGGHVLTLLARSTPALDAGINPRLPAALGVGGTLMSLLLSLSVWLLAVGRARAERRAREMTADLERLAKVVQHTSNAVVIIDERERVTWVNEGFERVFGYRRDDVLGQAPDALLRRAGADADELQLMRQALWRGTSWRGELHLRDRQDRACWIDIEIQPLREEGPAVVGLMAIASDITASKLAQQRLQETLHAREQAEVALREARARAEEANVAKSQFLANMSHEIRTPMNAIIGMSNLVMDSELDDDQRELLGVVQDSAQSLLSLINDILDFSKIEAGHLEFERIGFDLHEQVAATVRTLGPRAQEKGLALEWAIARDVPRHVVGDPHRLRQVLLNLLTNALKFTLQGGVTLLVSRRPEAQSDGQCTLHFRVRDTGIGIEPDKLQSVFEPFTQADASTTRRFGGTGLGLAICRRLVGLMGGELWAESEPGKGSTFHFTARLGLQAEADDDMPAGDGEPQPRVLVLDAAPAPDATLQATLAQWQLQPVVVGELAEALRRLESPARHHRAIQSVLVRASTLRLQPLEQLASLLPRLCDSATHGRPVILLEDELLPDARSRCFEVRVPWPGKPSSLFDAMTTVEGFTHSALNPADAGAAGSVGSAPARHRILLAEDNVINQKLALRLLEGMGHQVEVVADGQQAVQRAQTEAFDLILMDVQMPVMGGFEATAALRAHEQPLGRHTPIVAMTAHAMVGDRERCLAAGMDGYLSKPVSKLELYRAVQEHARRRDPAAVALDADDATPQAVPVAAPSEASSGTALYDRAQAVELLGGDEGLFDEVAGMFVAHAEAERQALRDAVAAGDLERLGRAAHGIKGSAATVGAAATSELASLLEQACQERERERAVSLVDGLCQRLDALEGELRRDLPAAAPG